jgi:glycosyltransferase involved in cell wall biosynthesis
LRSYKIIHIPQYSNPYQELLIDNLNKINLDVEFGKIVGFPHLGDISVFYNFIKNPTVLILHLHWTHRFLIGYNKVRTVLRSVSFIFQIILIKAFRKKVVWTVHNLKNHEGKHEKLEIYFSSILAHLVDTIIAHCQTSKREICRIYKIRNKKKIVVIPHGNLMNVYDNSLSRDQARRQLNILSEDLTFLFLGNIRRYKGVLELIESFQKIKENNSKLIIAGKLEDKELSDLISLKIKRVNNIQLIPSFISDDEIQIYMNAADIVIFPYRDIMTSGAAILAMSFGKAIIAPKIGCLHDILDNSGSFLYDPIEKDGLLHALIEAIDSREKFREMGHHNLNLAKKLSWRDIAVTTYKVYKGCLN